MEVVGFVSAVLAIAEVSGKLALGVRDFLKAHSEAVEERNRVVQNASELEASLAKTPSVPPGAAGHEAAIGKLGADAIKHSEELRKLVLSLDLSGKKSVGASVRAIIFKKTKGPEVVGLEKKIAECRTQILLRLGLMLRDDNSAIRGDIVQILKRAERCTTAGERLETLQNRILADIDTLQNSVGEHEQHRLEGDSARQAALDEQGRLLVDLGSALESLRLAQRDIPIQEWFLGQLYYPSMHGREDRTAVPETGTFGWLLDSPDWDNSLQYPYAREQRESRDFCANVFKEWLTDGRGVFHISGKAGCGKSTLMKYVSRHEDVRRRLEAWASPKKLVLASFYFTQESDEMGKSLHGLYRSLLFEVLKQCPELVSELFPTQWAYINSSISNPYDTGLGRDQFRQSEISKAFKRLLSHKEYQQHRFCFFIDGLDEYGGNEPRHFHHWTHEELATHLKCWADTTDLKICASSRPHLEFIDTFSGSPLRRIQLHEVTREDIYNMARQRLEASPHFRKIDMSPGSIALDIMRQSEGVFLWAILAVRSVLASAARGDTPTTIRSQVSSFPGDLDQLYQQIFDKMSPRELRTAEKMLWVTLINPLGDPLSAVSYTWLERLENDPDFPEVREEPRYSEAEMDSLLDKARKQLDGYTRGLLEIRHDTILWRKTYTSDGVHFIHRTLVDFLEATHAARLKINFGMLTSLDTFVRIRVAEETHRPPWHGPVIIDGGDEPLGDLTREPILSHYYKWFPCPTSKWSPNQTISASALSKLAKLASLNGFRVAYREADFGNTYWDTVAQKTGRHNTVRPELSFTHLAAACGLTDYVLEGVRESSDILRGKVDKENTSLLFSALTGLRFQWDKSSTPTIIQTLLRKGWSFEDKVQVLSRGFGDTRETVSVLSGGPGATRTVSLWDTTISSWLLLSLCARLACDDSRGYEYESIKPRIIETADDLAVLLRYGTAVPSEVLFFSVKYETFTIEYGLPSRFTDHVSREGLEHILCGTELPESLRDYNEEFWYVRISLETVIRTSSLPDLGELLDLMGFKKECADDEAPRNLDELVMATGNFATGWVTWRGERCWYLGDRYYTRIA